MVCIFFYTVIIYLEILLNHKTKSIILPSPLYYDYAKSLVDTSFVT